VCLPASSQSPLAANAVTRSMRSAVSARTKVGARWARASGEDCDRIGVVEAGQSGAHGFKIDNPLLGRRSPESGCSPRSGVSRCRGIGHAFVGIIYLVEAGTSAAAVHAALFTHRKYTIMADGAPIIQVGSDTRAKSQAEALRDAEFAIGETGLQVTFKSGPHIGGAGTLDGEGVAVIVTCLPVNGRTFIEVVGASLSGGTAEQARNRVRSITMGPAS
jgi:hypothetical protein